MLTSALCRRRFGQVAVALFVFGAAPAFAQVRPNFSGTWKEVQPPSSGSSRVETIEQRADSTLKVAVNSSFTGGMISGGFSGDHTYSIGGPEEVSKTDDGIIRGVSVAWDGRTLVFLRTELEGANTTTTREVWSLSENGRTLTRTRHTISWRGATDEKSVFERQL